MKRFVCGALLTTVVVLAFIGCASTGQITKGSPNYLQMGMASARFQGNEFYMVIGAVDLYHYNIWGNLKPTGQTVEIAVVVQAKKDTGEILRIATMQSRDSEGVTTLDGGAYVLADLRGGISVIDVQPYQRWLDAIQAMRKAITDLNTYTEFAGGGDQAAPVVVAVAPTWGWWGWGWGGGWGWRGGGYGRGGYRHWR